MALEAKLPAYLDQQLSSRRPAEPPDTYLRQYAGFVREGRRLIYVNFLHRQAVALSDSVAIEMGEEPEEWLRKGTVVCDGGDRFFGIEYDVRTGTFSDLHVNGSV